MSESSWRDIANKAAEESLVAATAFGTGASIGELFNSTNDNDRMRMYKNFTSRIGEIHQGQALLPELDLHINAAKEVALQAKSNYISPHAIRDFLRSELTISPFPEAKTWIPASSSELRQALTNEGGAKWVKSLSLDSKFKPGAGTYLGLAGLAFGEMLYHKNELENLFTGKKAYKL